MAARRCRVRPRAGFRSEWQRLRWPAGQVLIKSRRFSLFYSICYKHPASSKFEDDTHMQKNIDGSSSARDFPQQDSHSVRGLARTDLEGRAYAPAGRAGNRFDPNSGEFPVCQGVPGTGPPDVVARGRRGRKNPLRYPGKRQACAQNARPAAGTSTGGGDSVPAGCDSEEAVRRRRR